MMPVNGLEPEPALGGMSFAEGAETASSAGTGARGAGDAGRRGGFRLRRWHVVCALVVVAALVLGLCWRYLPDVYAWLSNPDAVHAYVEQHAVLSRLAIIGVNTLQIVLAILPGEPIELASGYAFGFWEGTAACLVAARWGPRWSIGPCAAGAGRLWGCSLPASSLSGLAGLRIRASSSSSCW